MKPDNSTLESAIKSRILILASLNAHVFGFAISKNLVDIPTIIFDCRTNYLTKHDEVFKSIGACWCAEIIDSSFEVCCELIVKDKESTVFMASLH